jgi:hypothetical protein
LLGEVEGRWRDEDIFQRLNIHRSMSIAWARLSGSAIVIARSSETKAGTNGHKSAHKAGNLHGGFDG